MADTGRMESKAAICCSFMKLYWKTFMVIFWPIILLPILLILDNEPKFRCMYIVALMGGYWVTECIPLYVTGLLPVVLVPLFSIDSTGNVTTNYFKDAVMLFMVGIFIAIAIEHSGLHIRIALVTIMVVGCSPRRLHFGLLCVTAFLSMWLANAATTAMMCPIIKAVLEELESQGIGSFYEPRKDREKGNDIQKDNNKEDNEDAIEIPVEKEAPQPSKCTLAYYLGVAYASTVGGIGSLVGTPTNLSYKGMYEDHFPKGNKIEFVAWMLFNVPCMIAMVVFIWFWMQFFYMGLLRPKSKEGKLAAEATRQKDTVQGVIKKKLSELGPMSWHEAWVLALFVLIIILWFFRSPKFMTGWADVISSKVTISDSSPAFFIIALMIVIPATKDCLFGCSKDPSRRPKHTSPGLVTWKVINDRYPWGLIFLLGGGFALAHAGKKSGMSHYLGERMSAMKNMPHFAVLAITTLFCTLATEMTSNVAICNIIIPILNNMAQAMKVHPMLMTMPAAINCSFAFLLPVGTPANAIVAGLANIRTTDMVKGGAMVKLFTWLIIFILFPTYGAIFWDLHSFPAWAEGNNSTAQH